MSEALEQKPDQSLPARAHSIAAFEEALGGREALFTILSQADTTPNIQLFLSWLGDERYKGSSLASLCRAADLTPGDLFLAYERALQVRAKVLARIPIAEQLPTVAADAMRRATTHTVLCPACRGRKTYLYKPSKGEPIEIACRECTDGWVQQEPSLDQQKMALELGELLLKPGLQINQNNSIDQSKTVNLGMNAALAKLQATAAEAAFTVEATAPDPPPVAEAEVLP